MVKSKRGGTSGPPAEPKKVAPSPPEEQLHPEPDRPLFVAGQPNPIPEAARAMAQQQKKMQGELDKRLRVPFNEHLDLINEMGRIMPAEVLAIAFAVSYERMTTKKKPLQEIYARVIAHRGTIETYYNHRAKELRRSDSKSAEKRRRRSRRDQSAETES